MDEKKELVLLLNEELSLELPWKIGIEELQDRLSAHIHFLLDKNFHKLLTILYRVDVSETKLRSLLKDHPDRDAGVIIAGLIIERQLEKIKSRRSFDRGKPYDIDNDELW